MGFALAVRKNDAGHSLNCFVSVIPSLPIFGFTFTFILLCETFEIKQPRSQCPLQQQCNAFDLILHLKSDE